MISSKGTTFTAGQTVTFAGTEAITISSTLVNTTIYYTTNGTMPNNFSSQGTAPLSLTVSQMRRSRRSQVQPTIFRAFPSR